MNKIQNNYHHSREELDDKIYKLFNIIKTFDPKAICKYYPDDDNGRTYTNPIYPYLSKNYEPIKIYIGTETLDKNEINGYVCDEDFVLTLCRTYHELCHAALRTQVFTSETNNKNSKNMTKLFQSLLTLSLKYNTR